MYIYIYILYILYIIIYTCISPGKSSCASSLTPFIGWWTTFTRISYIPPGVQIQMVEVSPAFSMSQICYPMAGNGWKKLYIYIYIYIIVVDVYIYIFQISLLMIIVFICFSLFHHIHTRQNRLAGVPRVPVCAAEGLEAAFGKSKMGQWKRVSGG